MGEEELFLTRLFLFLKLKKKKTSQNVNKEPRFFMREIFETRLFVSFLIFVKQGMIFLNFFGQWFLLAQQEWRFSYSF